MRRAFALSAAGFALLLLAACSDDSTSSTPSPTPAPTQSVAQQITALETSGRLPALDRSPSISGPDTNTNGIRDDVEAYLNAQPYSVPQRNAALQIAKAMQTVLLVPSGDQASSDAAALASMRAVHCLFDRFSASTSPTAGETLNLIEKLTANTKARSQAYLAYNDSRDGTVSTWPREDTCD